MPQRHCSALNEKYPKTHTGLVAQFWLDFVKEDVIEEYYARAITTAQERRERADCDIYYSPSKDEAESMVEDAEKFLERMRNAIDELRMAGR